MLKLRKKFLPLFTPFTNSISSFSSMILALQWYSFRVEYQKGFSIHIADTLSQAPLPTTSHKQVHDDPLHLTFPTFQDATFQDIRAAASSDPKQIALHPLVLTGWPNDKLAVPELALPYWSVHHELTVHDGLFFKQNRVIIPSSL
ncbi:unnamed protein product [Porites evermanni]|uniref:Uncharacterized protein n=1 Tax=Porites evermanni TaxID=104178 RepID=A0ABN8LQL1_9CNID|nr:unnamed protein product [Porites evermanni]